MKRSVKLVRQEFKEALDTATLNGVWLPCVDNPIPYTEVRQTPEQAEDLCVNCPLLEIHREFAQATKVDREVAGGIFWIKGRPQPVRS